MTFELKNKSKNLLSRKCITRYWVKKILYFSLSSKEFWRYCVPVLIIFMDNHFCGFNNIITVFTIQYLNLWSGQCFNKYNLLYMYYKLLNIALQRTWFKDFSDSIRNSINSIRKVTKNKNLKNIDIFFFWPVIFDSVTFYDIGVICYLQGIQLWSKIYLKVLHYTYTYTF